MQGGQRGGEEKLYFSQGRALGGSDCSVQIWAIKQEIWVKISPGQENKYKGSEVEKSHMNWRQACVAKNEYKVKSV